MCLETLSLELKHIVIGFLDFITLLNLRNTSKAWRDTVNLALSQTGVIHSARAKLLRLYLDLPNYPSFLAAREYILPHLKPFSRNQYLENLRTEISKHSSSARIPDEFELWILEWPENAVIGWAWPGLDGSFNMQAGKRGKKLLFRSRNHQDNQAHWWRVHGANTLSVLEEPDLGSGYGRLFLSMEEELLGLPVAFHGCQYYTILLFGHMKIGREMVWSGDICEMEEMIECGKYFEGTWVEWLRAELKRIEDQYAIEEVQVSESKEGLRVEDSSLTSGKMRRAL